MKGKAKALQFIELGGDLPVHQGDGAGQAAVRPLMFHEKENITGKEFLDLLGIEPEKTETEAETKHEAEVDTEAVVETKPEDENE